MTRTSAKNISLPKDIPSWLVSHYPHQSQNMNKLATSLNNVIDYIAPYIEDGFCENHIKEPLNVNYDKPLFEGLWHLHVLWCIYAHGLDLEKPDKKIDDDIIINYKGNHMGVETTFSGWGGPKTELHRMYSQRVIEMDTIDELILQQAIIVLEHKEEKLAKRRGKSKIDRFVALNEVFLTNGFGEWNRNPDDRRVAIFKKLQSFNTSGINGLIYDFVSYHDYFRDPRLTLLSLDKDNTLHSDLVTILKS
jgi:hypothetical protein